LVSKYFGLNSTQLVNPKLSINLFQKSFPFAPQGSPTILKKNSLSLKRDAAFNKISSPLYGLIKPQNNISRQGFFLSFFLIDFLLIVC